MSNLSNLDNYIRILCLVFETAPYALGKLMLQYLNRTNMTLPDLINKHQHEIYHYFTDKKCCRNKVDFNEMMYALSVFEIRLSSLLARKLQN